MKILMVMTSHDRLGDTGKKTGLWLEEFATPYYVFKDAGAQIVLASPKGGQPPIDPGSDAPDAQTSATARFRTDSVATSMLANTCKLSDVVEEEFDAVFYPGGHGPLWDLAEDRDSIHLIEKTYAAGKPVGTVCHAPAVLQYARGPLGLPLVRGLKVTGFSDTEEAAVGLTNVVPFLVEDMLKQNGGEYSKKDDWKPYAITDGNLVTGQNPASSANAAHAVLTLLSEREASQQESAPLAMAS
jgi:putative intracellular protease/amidase